MALALGFGKPGGPQKCRLRGRKEESGSKRKGIHMSRERERKRRIAIFKNETCRDFPGGLVVKTWPSSAGAVGE